MFKLFRRKELHGERERAEKHIERLIEQTHVHVTSAKAAYLGNQEASSLGTIDVNLFMVPFIIGVIEESDYVSGYVDKVTPEERSFSVIVPYMTRYMNFSAEDAKTTAGRVAALLSGSDKFTEYAHEAGCRSVRDPAHDYLSEVVGKFCDLIEQIPPLVREIERLDWSLEPGAHELHLRRRSKNPYFPVSKRVIAQDNLISAKEKDWEGLEICCARYKWIKEEIASKLLQESLLFEDLNQLRESCDDVVSLCLGVDGQAKNIATDVSLMRENIIGVMRDAYSKDAGALERIERAELFSQDIMKKFHIPVIAHILNKTKPIPQEETIASIVSESPEAIMVFLEVVQPEMKPIYQAEALRLLKSVLDAGHIDPQCSDKLAAIEGRWPC